MSSPDDSKLVCEYLFGPCSEGLLDELADDGSNPYWYKVRAFIDRVDHFKLSQLSFDQRQWLIKIKEGLIEEAKKRYH